MTGIAADASPEVWAVGRSVTDQATILWPALRSERASAAELAATVLAAHGVGPDCLVMVIAMNSDGVGFVPIEDGVRALGAVPVPADASRLDARRVAAFTRDFALDAIVGLSGATQSGFDDLGIDSSVLADVPVILALPAAAAALRDAGRDVFLCVPMGPALALECPARRGAHVDGQTWVPMLDDGLVVLHTRHALEGRPETVATGVRGALVAGACPCGHDGPSVTVG